VHISHPRPQPCALIHVKVMGNCPSLNITLLHTCNLGNVVFAWSILSWIMHRNSSFNHTNFVFQVCYKFLHDFWCKICFLSFPHILEPHCYSFPIWISSLQGFTNSAFYKHEPCFRTSTFTWCLFLNLFIANWEIPPMFNSLLKNKEILASP
jgi:hypothetical protein